MPTDEELAKTAYAAWAEAPDAGALWDEATDGERFDWVMVVRAVRAALLPAVEPLAPGESVRVEEAGRDGYDLQLVNDCGMLCVSSDVDGLYLDAAGVAALREACERWEKAQEGDDV